MRHYVKDSWEVYLWDDGDFQVFCDGVQVEDAPWQLAASLVWQGRKV